MSFLSRRAGEDVFMEIFYHNYGAVVLENQTVQSVVLVEPS